MNARGAPLFPVVAGARQPVAGCPPGAFQLSLPLTAASAPAGEPRRSSSRPPLPVPSRRCAEKGCVFPVAPGGGDRCLHHRRQEDEPALYSSRQPSSAVVARGKFGPVSAAAIRDASDLPSHERRRMEAEREDFLSD